MNRRAPVALAAAIVWAASACSKPHDDGAAGRMLPGGSAGPDVPPVARVLPAGGDFTLVGGRSQRHFALFT